MQKSYIEKIAAKRDEAQRLESRALESLAGLCQTEGYRYLQVIAAEIEAGYRCKPTDPNWHVYTTIGYAFGTLFSKASQKAREVHDGATGPTNGKSILAEIQNARNSRP